MLKWFLCHFNTVINLNILVRYFPFDLSAQLTTYAVYEIFKSLKLCGFYFVTANHYSFSE